MKIHYLKISLILFLLQVSLTCFGSEVDSTVVRLIEESKDVSGNNLSLASYKAKRAIRIAQRKGYPKLLGEAYFNYGNLLRKKHFYQEALQAYLNAEQIFTRQSQDSLVYVLNEVIAELFLENNSYKEALVLYHQLQNAALIRKEQTKLAYFTLKLALCQYKLEMFDESELELKKSKRLYRQVADHKSVQDIVLLEALLLKSKKEYERGIKLLENYMAKNVNLEISMAPVLLQLGELNLAYGRRAEAYGYFEKARKEFQKTESFVNEANALVLISDLFSIGDSLLPYLDYLLDAERIFETKKLRYSQAYSQIKIASFYQLQEKYDSALMFLDKAYAAYNMLDSKIGMAKTKYLKGDLSFKNGNRSLALENYNTSSKLFLELGDTLNYKRSFIDLVEVQNSLGLYEKSRKVLHRSEALFERASVDLRKEYLELYSEVCSNLKLHDKALKLYKKAVLLRDSVENNEHTKAFEQLKWFYKGELNRYNAQQGIVDIAIWEDDAEQVKENTDMKRFYLLVIALGVFVILVFVVIFYVQKHANSLTKKELSDRTNELFKKEREYNLSKSIVEHQNKIISQQNYDIEKSTENTRSNLLNLLPEKTELDEVLGDNLLVYKAKQAELSGDFYWVHENGGIKTIVLGDSSGTVVSAALMSVFVLNLLNELKEHNIYDSADYMNAINEQVIEYLYETGGAQSGLRMAVVCIDTQREELRFSGARMSLYHFRNEKLTKLKGDNHAIGFGANKNLFRTRIMKLQSFDQLLLMSKGVVNSTKTGLKKKLTDKKLMNELEVLSSYEIEEQRKALYHLLDLKDTHSDLIDDMSLLSWKAL
jgi:serine phosphatase RsbU (regulator of sigma subunit)